MLAQTLNGIAEKVSTEEAGTVAEEKFLRLAELKRVQGMIIV